MIEKLLKALIKREKVLSAILSFVLGASAAALGVNAEAVKTEFCKSELTIID